MITYGSTTLTSYNTITNIEVYYYKSTSATSLSGGSWSTTKPTWENGKYIWQKIRTTYEGELENGLYYSESDPVNITGQQGATGTAAYSYKLNASDTTVTVSKIGAYSVNKITFIATSKQGTGSVNAYAGRFKIETTVNGTTWTTSYTSSGNESSKEFTIPTGIIAIRCSLYQANGTTTLLDIMTIPILSDDRPIATKTYSGLIGSANDAANASFYFAKIHPDNYTTNYKVKMKVRVTAPEAYAETIDIQFGGYENTFSSFDAYTTRTGSIGVYYINLYRATQAGISTNHKGHALGIGLRSSTNPTNTSYKRTIIIDILELDGCTVEMLNTAVKYASIDGTGSTNYYGLTEMAVGTAGQNATNNSNTHYTQYSNNVKAGTNGIKGYTLIMKDSENTWSCFYSGVYKVANTGKPVYTGGFMLGKILYSAGAGAQTSDSSLDTYYNYKSGVNTSTIYDAYPVDLRYSTNCASTLTSQRPVYIVGTIENDGLFHLDVSQWYTQAEPTYADGKVYVYVGIAYSTYQVWLSTENPAYMFYNGEFILYDKAQTLQNINTLKNSLETQIDSKVETWCQKTNPANSWTAEERPNHTGDLWYYIGESGTTYKNNTTYQYNGETNVWSAYSANPDLFDKIDGKSTIYYGTTSSVTSAEEGDYLVDSENDCTYRWNNGAWVLATDYKQVAIDAIEIGGRNLLLNTTINANNLSKIRANPCFSFAVEDGIDCYKTTGNNTAHLFNGTDAWDCLSEKLKANTTYTYSAWIKTNKTKALGYSQYGHFNVSNSASTKSDKTHEDIAEKRIFKPEIVEEGQWTKISITFTTNDLDGSSFGIYPVYNTGTDTILYTYGMKLEKGNIATDWTPAPEDVEESIRSYAQSIQSQVDGMAEIHYGTAVPTLSNAPYISWTDTATRDMHVDDLYYNTSTGYCYRFTKSGSTYSWIRIKDSDITAAATAASNANTAAGNAQTTANSANELAGQKRRIFVATPTTAQAYDIGDLWVEGSTGDIKKCKKAKASGVEYNASDWELASKYTDDTTANTANTKVDNLKKVRLGWRVNHDGFSTSNNGECYFHGYNANNADADVDGIVDWNGADLTITKGMWINPNSAAPFNIPILHVYRTSVSPYHSDVWWDDTLKKWRGYMYTTSKVPGTVTDWTWDETTDCILATYVEPASETAIQSAQLFNPPKKFSEISDPNTIKNAINAIEIGGRNLLINSSGFDPTINPYTNSTVTEYTSSFDGEKYYYCSGSKFVQIDFPTLIDTAEYILSFDIVRGNSVPIYITYGETTENVGNTPSLVWKRINYKFTASASITSAKIQVHNTSNNNTYIAAFRNFKLEKGNKPTDWTPAPEDMQTDIDTALAQSIWYATCSTAGATLLKEATITPATTNFKLEIGTAVNIKFDNTNSGARTSLTLNVNNTGAKNIKFINNNTITDIPGNGYILGGRTYLFIYDGTYWVIQNLNYNSNETNHVLNNFSGKTGELGIWQTGLFMRDGNGTYQNICTNNAGAVTRTAEYNKKANTKGFEIGSSIYFSPSNTYGANANITGAVYASYGAFDSRYSLNAEGANALTAYMPIYLTGTINDVDGLFHLDTVWWTQTPTNSDKVYVLIGGCYDYYHATSADYWRITLHEQNNWYKYVNGALVDYSNNLAELAATTATAFIAVDTDNNGIMVHPEDDMASGWQIGDAIQLFKNGISYIRMWIQDNIPKIRIGDEDKNHIVIDDEAIRLHGEDSNGETKELATYSADGITFDPETSYKIGNNNSYISFEDEDNNKKLKIVADSIEFTNTGDVQKQLDDLQGNLDLRDQYIKIDTGDTEATPPVSPSITIAASLDGEATNLKLEPDKLSFQVNGQPTATMTNDKMNIPTASVTNLFMESSGHQKIWVLRENGHLSLKAGKIME